MTFAASQEVTLSQPTGFQSLELDLQAASRGPKNDFRSVMQALLNCKHLSELEDLKA